MWSAEEPPPTFPLGGEVIRSFAEPSELGVSQTGFNTDWARLIARIDTLTQRVDALSERPGRKEIGPSIYRPDELFVDRVIDRIEVKKFEAMSLVEILRLVNLFEFPDNEAGYESARCAIRVALERSLSPEDRARVQTSLAVIQMESGKPEESTRLLEDVIRDAGIDSGVGGKSALLLATYQGDAGDHHGARRLAVTVARSAVLGEPTRVRARRLAAWHAFKAGDVDLARAEAESLIQKYPTMSKMRDLLNRMK